MNQNPRRENGSSLARVLLTSSLLGITNRLLVIHSQLSVFRTFQTPFFSFFFRRSIFQLRLLVLLFGYLFIFSHILALSAAFWQKVLLLLYGSYDDDVISSQMKEKMRAKYRRRRE